MSDIVETIKYKNHDINIYYDQFAENPFSWDCEPDIIVYYNRSFVSCGSTSYEYLPDLTREEIKNNIDKIKQETKTRTLLNFIKEYGSDLLSYSDTTDAINDTLQEYFNNLYDNEKLEFLSFVYGLKGVVTLCGASTGCSQGSYAEVLVIASNEFIERTGATIENPEVLQSTIDLYGFWAWGDCYYYTINQIDDSCGGFYGSDHDKSGLLEIAKNAIDSEITYNEKKRINKLKAMIKNNVPLNYRINYDY